MDTSLEAEPVEELIEDFFPIFSQAACVVNRDDARHSKVSLRRNEAEDDDEDEEDSGGCGSVDHQHFANTSRLAGRRGQQQQATQLGRARRCSRSGSRSKDRDSCRSNISSSDDDDDDDVQEVEAEGDGEEDELCTANSIRLSREGTGRDSRGKGEEEEEHHTPSSPSAGHESVERPAAATVADDTSSDVPPLLKPASHERASPKEVADNFRESSYGKAAETSPPTAATASSVHGRKRPHLPWPQLPCPIPSSHLYGRSQTRGGFHSKQYAAFVRAYAGLSPADAEQAQRRARGMCVIGMRRSKDARGLLRGATQRGFLRHSVLAVEGDDLFTLLIDRAEMLQRLEQRRVMAEMPASVRARVEEQLRQEGGSEDGESPPYSVPMRKMLMDAAVSSYSKPPRPSSSHRKASSTAPVAVSQEAHLRPNARCIALHYGLPQERSANVKAPPPPSSSTKRKPYVKLEEEEASAQSTFPRATLMVIISTTRLEENTEVYVSLESYYRCLDEAAWYRTTYGERDINEPVRRSAEAAAAESNSSPPPPPPSLEQPQSQQHHGMCNSDPMNELVGDLYSGVKRFHRWPAGLDYFHGVGKQHASPVAQGGFPFTLLSLSPAPELGEKEMGITAANFVPYATCFMYTGPSVAAKKVEALAGPAVIETPGSKSSKTSGKKQPTTAEDKCEKNSVGSSRKRRGKSTKRRCEGQEHHVKHEDEEEEATEAPEDLSFMLDDTYALGLGGRGVCFGQGLTRYINHRYNISRFGNTELCTVMLSVPSEFAEIEDDEGSGRGGSGGGGGGASGSGGVSSSHAAKQQQTVFLEEQSHFITIPFFITTSDVEAGQPLLAWTYGEEYDAKLERIAVAGGPLVPHADAAVLNQRLSVLSATPPSPTDNSSLPSFTSSSAALIDESAQVVPRLPPPVLLQRYNGDYRFAVRVGDIVWRRRPHYPDPPKMHRRRGHSSYASVASPCPLSYSFFCPEGKRCSSPDMDLFVVVEMMRSGVEWVLLRHLTPTEVSQAELEGLLTKVPAGGHHMRSPRAPAREFIGEESDLADPAAVASAVSKEETQDTKRLCDDEDVVDGILGTTVNRSKRRRAEEAATAAAAEAALTKKTWLVFDVSAAKRQDQLRTCLVATLDTCGLLLSGTDYHSISQRVTRTGCQLSHRVLIHRPRLREAASLVVRSERGTAVPEMLSGQLWPLFSEMTTRSLFSVS